ncbi:hypothetical protein [Synoicihabitans lomoniglobus]|uniref:Uncharacterized protein n=1 Tax=Synoicihabitans lomoniglobus TaxID=2909285 RepID=A0AAE9ZX76_9BACT|nr:hypothetical protein [Opitutaceae bacterium LMO-M01]WED64869.1 hypothetical protein PXH66_21190 [Opitutaceae bacterium LMO-M01]
MPTSTVSPSEPPSSASQASPALESPKQGAEPTARFSPDPATAEVSAAGLHYAALSHFFARFAPPRPISETDSPSSAR